MSDATETPAEVETAAATADELTSEQKIDVCNQQLAAFRMELGTLRQNYVTHEARLVQAIAEVQTALTGTVEALAAEQGLDLTNERWNFDITKKEFTKVESA